MFQPSGGIYQRSLLSCEERTVHFDSLAYVTILTDCIIDSNSLNSSISRIVDVRQQSNSAKLSSTAGAKLSLYCSHPVDSPSPQLPILGLPKQTACFGTVFTHTDPRSLALHLRVVPYLNFLGRSCTPPTLRLFSCLAPTLSLLGGSRLSRHLTSIPHWSKLSRAHQLFSNCISCFTNRQSTKWRSLLFSFQALGQSDSRTCSFLYYFYYDQQPSHSCLV